jgi:hypothetical protein
MKSDAQLDHLNISMAADDVARNATLMRLRELEAMAIDRVGFVAPRDQVVADRLERWACDERLVREA